MSIADSRPFNLLWWFAALSFITILLISALLAFVLSRFMSTNLLDRDAVVSMEYIQSVSQINDPREYFSGEIEEKSQLIEFFDHITRLPDVLRANIYNKSRTIVWSNEKELIGRRFGDNDELEQALSGRLVVQHKQLKKAHKAEYRFFPDDTTQFLENYIPIWNENNTEVVGVAELYKRPVSLFRSLEQGRSLVWTISFLGGLFLYAVLFWIVWRGGVLINRQQKALVESERMGVVGSMVASVAHSIRNPIASMRSSAELAMEDATPDVREYLQDIITEVDRFDEWVRELLSFSQNGADRNQVIAINNVIESSLGSFEDRPRKQGIRVTLDVPENLPQVVGESALLEKVFHSLISNAIEAMPQGGELILSVESRPSSLRVRVCDNGTGIPKDRLTDVFVPFSSSKSNGLGVGLALARKVVEGYGGSIEILSAEGHGTTALVTLPIAS